MVRRSRLAASDVVWDIGAGDGALCVPLAHRAGHVVAVESDGSLVERLRARVAMLGNVSVVHRDFLTLRLPDQDFIVVANLPFAITTAVLRRVKYPKWCKSDRPPGRLGLTYRRRLGRRPLSCLRARGRPRRGEARRVQVAPPRRPLLVDLQQHGPQ